MADKALNTFTIGQGKLVPADHYGPASYSTGGELVGNTNSMTGISILGLGSLDYLDACDLTISGNYQILVQPTGTGERKQFRLIWIGSAFGTGVTGVTVSGGTGMTPGTYALSFSGGGGSGAAGTITVLTATTTSTPVITNPGKGYTTAPTVTAATGGTPPTLTATVTAAGAQPASGANLSGEIARVVYVGR